MTWKSWLWWHWRVRWMTHARADHDVRRQIVDRLGQLDSLLVQKGWLFALISDERLNEQGNESGRDERGFAREVMISTALRELGVLWLPSKMYTSVARVHERSTDGCRSHSRAFERVIRYCCIV